MTGQPTTIRQQSDARRSTTEATVVVPTRNGAARLECLLASLDGSAATVVVVDNGSTDATASVAAAHGAETIRLERNVGYGRAVNLAASEAADGALVLLNDDCVCRPGFVEQLVGGLDPGSGVVMAGGVLLEPTGETIDTAGMEVDRTLLVFDFLNGEPASIIDGPVADPFGPSGAAAAFDRSAFVRIGGFDERLFAYWEDVDLVLRLRAAGGRNRLVTAAVGTHEHSATLGSGSAAKNYLTGFGRTYVHRKWCGVGPATLTRVVVRDAPIVAGQALVDRNVAGLRGRRDGWRAAAEVPRHHIAPATRSQLTAGGALVRRLRRRARLRARDNLG
jgi:N-acetylglucosaminyl-diphospho-decaprenol L-rhamnosyltransferase